MLDLHFYRNVPFQSDYANVILFQNKNALITYLSTYQIGVLNDVAMYWYNGNQIDLETIYEDANYLWIHDTNAVIPDKFYFIESIENESASSGRYNLTCDIWHTYSYDMDFKPSLCINGHAEVIAPYKQYYLSDYVPKYEYYLNTTNDAAGNKLLKSIADATNGRMTAMAIVTFESNADYGTSILFSREKFDNDVTFNEILFRFMGNLMINKASSLDSNGDILNTYTFKIERVYLIPDFILYDILESMQETPDRQPYDHEAFVPYRKMLLGNALPELNTDINQCYRYNPNYIISGAGVSPIVHKYLPYLKIEMASSGAFDISKIKPNAKYMLGTITNAVEIHAAKNTNFNMKLNMFITETNGLSIFIEASNKMINITNDFEIPYVNDNYTLYMAANQATIDASNKNATIQFATSMTMAAAGIAAAYMSGGASLALVGGAIGAGAGFAQNRIKQNATLEDAKKIIGKNDGVYAGGGVTINYGVGVFEYVSNDNYANDYLNNYGNTFNAILDNYKFTDADYNFYYIKFGEVNITGNFNNGIKKQLEAILLNGVRFWIDSSNFLLNVPYKKP